MSGNELPTAERGHFEFDSKNIAKLKCNNGYKSGITYSYLVQSKNGIFAWDPPHVVCVPASCPVPPLLENGFIEGREFNYPKRIAYHCNEGYRLNKNLNDHYCTATGHWQPPIGAYECLPITCKELDPPENGTVSYHPPTRIFGSVARYKCNPGFRKVEDGERTCKSDSMWSGKAVRCDAVSCPPLPENLRVIFSSPELTVFTCDGTDSKSMRCTSEGQWTLPPPYCEIQKHIPPSRKNNNDEKEEEEEETPNGSQPKIVSGNNNNNKNNSKPQAPIDPIQNYPVVNNNNNNSSRRNSSSNKNIVPYCYVLAFFLFITAIFLYLQIM